MGAMGDRAATGGGKEWPLVSKGASSRRRKAAVSVAAGSNEENTSLLLRRATSILAAPIAPSASEATPRHLPNTRRSSPSTLFLPPVHLTSSRIPTSYLTPFFEVLTALNKAHSHLAVWIAPCTRRPQIPTYLVTKHQLIAPLPLVCTQSWHHGWSGV